MTFVVEAAVQTGPSEVEITYSALPLATGTGPYDALDPRKYTLTGPGSPRVVEVLEVLSDLRKFRLVTAQALVTGPWKLGVSGVRTAAGEPLPSTVVVVQAAQLRPSAPGGPQRQARGYDIVAESLSPAFSGKNWEAAKKALGWSIQKDLDYARAVSDQAFLHSSSGGGLDKRALEVGVRRPAAVGIPDDPFRRLAELASWEKLTRPGLWHLLDVFYGPAMTRATAKTGPAEPFALVGGESLDLEVGGELFGAVVEAAALDVPGAATAHSVASALNLQLATLRAPLFADTVLDVDGYRVVLVSRAIGSPASFRVLGGKAQHVLQFPTRVDYYSPPSALPTWTVAPVPLDAATTLTCVDPNGADLTVVRPGDYVTVYGSEFLAANRGTFTVLEVTVTVTAGARTQTLKVTNRSGAAQVVAQLAEGSMQVFRPDPVRQPVDGPVLTQTGGTIRAELPTTNVVTPRDLSSAGYLHDSSTLPATATRLDGVVTVTTGSPHGLGVGDVVALRSPVLSYSPPSVVAAGAGTTSASALSNWSAVSDMATARSEHGASQLDSGDVLVCGGTAGAGYLSSCQRFRVTADTVLAGGKRRLSYSWVATASMPTALGRFCVTHLPYAGLSFLTGGWDGANASSEVSVYDEAVNTWTVLAPMTFERYWHTAVASSDKLFVVSGNNGAVLLNSVEVYDHDTGAWTAGPILSLNRERHATAKFVKAGSVHLLTAGGLDSGGEILAECEYWNTSVVVSEWTRCGNMAWARYGHQLIEIGDGRVLAVGGIGRPANEPTAVAGPVSVVEMFDPATLSWTNAGSLVAGVGLGFAVGLPEGVFAAAGGSSHTSLREPSGRWRRSAASLDISPVGPAFAGSDWVLSCGGEIGATPTAKARVLIPSRELVGGPPLPELVKITTVPTSTTFTFEQAGLPPNSASWTSLLVCASPMSGSWTGPFAFSPHEGMMAGSFSTTLSQELVAGQKYSEISVASGPPASVGWFGVDLGGALETGPVRHLGPASPTKMRIDANFVWPKTIPVGTQLFGLVQRDPYSPELGDHQAYATPSDAASVLARSMLEEWSASGLRKEIVLRYPTVDGMGRGDGPVVWSGE